MKLKFFRNRALFRSPLTPAFQLCLRAAVSAGASVALANLLRLQYPIYALIGAVIVTDLSPSQTRRLGYRRLSGSVLGAVVGAAATQFLPPGPGTIGITIMTAMFLSHLLRLQGAATVSGYVSGIVVLNHGGYAWSYGLYRVIETVLGIGIAMLVSLVPKLIRLDEPKP